MNCKFVLTVLNISVIRGFTIAILFGNIACSSQKPDWNQIIKKDWYSVIKNPEGSIVDYREVYFDGKNSYVFSSLTGQVSFIYEYKILGSKINFYDKIVVRDTFVQRALKGGDSIMMIIGETTTAELNCIEDDNGLLSDFINEKIDEETYKNNSVRRMKKYVPSLFTEN